MKKFFVILLVIIMLISTACNNVSDDSVEVDELSLFDKAFYADTIGFEFRIYIDGYWHTVNDFTTIWSMINPSGSRYTGFHTELRFVKHRNEAENLPNTIVVAYPNEDTVQDVLTVINWEVDSSSIDLNRFGLTYPITVENLVEDYAIMDWLIYTYGALGSPTFIYSVAAGSTDIGTRIGFDLGRSSIGSENTEKVLDILDQLNMTEDEAGPLIRASGSLERFIAVTNLMLEEGITSERALRRTG